jgi:hypothetical protein
VLTGTSPVWSILHQLYGYTALLEEAVQQLCKVQLTQHAQTSFCSFCTTTILASNHKGSFCGSSCVFSPMQQESLHSIIAAIDKQGVSTCVLDCHSKQSCRYHLDILYVQWARCASYTTELSLLHSRIGDKALKFILSKASLFVALGSGRNYVQITGIPIYNVIGCTYTPLLTKIHLGKRRTRIEVDQLAAITQSRASCPLAKKLDLAESHSGMSNGRSDTTPVTAGPVLHYPPTSKCPVIQSASTAVRSRHIRGRSLRNFNRRRRRLYQKRKRVAARLRRRSSGRNTLSPAERGQLRQLRKIWNTAHKKKDIMYCSSSQEYLRKSRMQ